MVELKTIGKASGIMNDTVSWASNPAAEPGPAAADDQPDPAPGARERKSGPAG